MKLDVGVRLPHEAETVGMIRGIVTGALRSLGVTDDCIHDIRLALNEACTNVTVHSTDDDDYEVRLTVDEWQCAIAVKDAGKGFDVAALSGLIPDELSARGRGVAIMQALMDRVDLDSEPEAGTIVRLVKTLAINPNGPLARLRGRAESLQ